MAGPSKSGVKPPPNYFAGPVQTGGVVQTTIICAFAFVALALIVAAVIHCWKGQDNLIEFATNIKNGVLYLHNGLLILIGYATLYGWLGTIIVSSLWEQIKKFPSKHTD